MAPYPEIKLYIGGEWRGTAETQPVVNPATGQSIGDVPVASHADLDDAVAAAREGYRVWSQTAPAKRAEIMVRAASLLRARGDEIAEVITREHGKPLHEARMEVVRGCEFFEWDAGEAVRAYGRVIPSAPGIKYIVVHQPIGAVAAFSPWNFPMSQPARKVAGAIAAGCSIILKASEETPGGAIHLARAFHDAGLPQGVLNLVFGIPDDISAHLIPKPEIRLVAFTGSTVVGKHLSVLAAKNMKPVLMELGGHAPVIVCDDVDPVAAGRECASRKMRNAGQVCTSPTRFYVHQASFERFTAAFVEKAASLRVGDGLVAGTDMGPLANHRRVSALQALVDDARARGARVLTGGERLDRPGYFFPPTVLADVPLAARVMREEPFGPLAVINPFSTLDDAIEQANSLPFGLAAYGFTRSARNADLLAERLEAGNVSINTLEASVAETPFGGVKESGYGREGGMEGLANYMIVKNVSHLVSY